MAEIEINPIEFITVGTVGPKGKRQFNLQAGADKQNITLTLEKEQARRLAEAINELLDSVIKNGRNPEKTVNLNELEMELREPIEPLFRVSQMGLGYDDVVDRVVLVIEELAVRLTDEETDEEEIDTQIIRFWGTREQFRALAIHTTQIVDQGRPDPQHNGYTIYYWV